MSDDDNVSKSDDLINKGVDSLQRPPPREKFFCDTSLSKVCVGIILVVVLFSLTGVILKPLSKESSRGGGGKFTSRVSGGSVDRLPDRDGGMGAAVTGGGGMLLKKLKSPQSHSIEALLANLKLGRITYDDRGQVEVAEVTPHSNISRVDPPFQFSKTAKSFDWSLKFPRGGINHIESPPQFYYHRKLAKSIDGESNPEQLKKNPLYQGGFSSKDLVRGKVAITDAFRPGDLSMVNKSLAVDHIREEAPLLFNSSNKNKGENGRDEYRLPSLDAALCTLVYPNEESLAVEWIQWHRILGVGKFYLYLVNPTKRQTNDTATTSHKKGNEEVLFDIAQQKLRWYLHPLLQEGIVSLLSLQSKVEEIPNELLVMHHCVKKAAAVHRNLVTSSPSTLMGFLRLSDKIVLPQGDSFFSSRRRSRKKPVEALAVVKTIVGHNGEIADFHRTQFERTLFGMGLEGEHLVHFLNRGYAPAIELQIFMTQREWVSTLESLEGPSSSRPKLTISFDLRSNLFHNNETGSDLKKSNTGEMVETLLSQIVPGDPERPLSSLTIAASQKFISQLPALLNTSRILNYRFRSLSAILWATLTQGFPSQRVFSLALLRQAWHSQKTVGFTAITFYDNLLRKQHAMLLRSMGYIPGERTRAIASPTPLTPVQKERLSPLFGIRPSRDYKLLKNLTNKNIVAGSGGIRLIKEKHMRPLSEKEVSIPNESECQNKNTTIEGGGEVVFCTYVRNRNKLTVEWIQYHRILGVKRFIVFDDGSTDDLREYLEPLIRANIVQYFTGKELPPYRFRNFPVAGGMIDAYGECLALEAEKKSWVGLFDSDEFLHIPNEKKCVGDLVKVAKARSSIAEVGAVAFPWKHVGHTGELIDQAPTQFDRTHMSAGSYDEVERVKCIIRADLPVAMETAHLAELTPPWVTVDSRGKPIRGNGWWSRLRRGNMVFDDAFILHYHARSAASWLQKQIDGFSDNDDRIFEEDVWEFEASVWLNRWRGAMETSNSPKLTHMQGKLSLLRRSLPE